MAVTQVPRANRYLVIQLRDLGDVILSTALCSTHKKSFPGATVDMLTMDDAVGVVRGNPGIDNIVVLDRKRRSSPRYMLGFLRDLRAARYDVLINSQGQIIGLLACLFSGAHTRIGFGSWPWRLGHSTSIRFRASRVESGACHTLDDRFTLLAPLAPQQLDRQYRIRHQELCRPKK